MVICSDTSFLFSFYANDSKTAAAVPWNTQNPTSIVISSFNQFELMNALRFAECRRFIGVGDFLKFAGDFKGDLLASRLLESSCSLGDILTEADRLSALHTLTGGHRGFDILHIAAAKVIGASHFLTFDANQKRLAENEGMIVPL